MQILFKKGFENGESYGLDYFDGDVTKMSDKDNQITPHRMEKRQAFLMIMSLIITREKSFIMFILMNANH